MSRHDPAPDGGRDATAEALGSVRDTLAEGRQLLKHVEDSFHAAEGHVADAERRLVHLRRELREAQRAAVIAERIKTEFLRNMTHELRTPLNAILGYADLLIEGDDLPADVRAEHAQTLREHGKHLLALLSDIFDLSLLRAGEGAQPRTATSLRELVEPIADRVDTEARAKGIGFELAYLGALPTHIHTDPERFRKVLEKLLENAVQNTNVGGVRLMIRHVITAGRDEVQFDVVDTGQGISPASLERVFEAFEQADASMTRTLGGAGLGLTVAREMASVLGGTLSAESIEGHGSVFQLRVEAGDASELDLQRFAPWRSKQEEASTGGLLDELQGARLDSRVLYVDDGADNRRLISFILRKAGLQNELAENGQEALDRVERAEGEGRPFDLILMDLQMPVLDGFEATRRLRARGFDRPIIAVTAHALDEERTRALEAGCDQFVTKPISRRELLAVLVERLKNSPRS